MPSLNDLRRAFFGASASSSVTDAEYQQLLALFNQNATLQGLVGGGGRGEVKLRGSVLSDWSRKIMTTDVNAPDTALSIEHGQLVNRVIGGSGTQSNRREAWTVPDFLPCRNQRVRARLASHPPADGTVEHVLGLRFQEVGGKYRQITVWDFGFGLILAGIWESNTDGSGFVVTQAAQADRDTFTGGSRTTNVVTLTGLPAGANTRWFVGDLIQVNATDNVYDGFFQITAVTDTTITYTQAAADDASSGAGTLALGGRGNESGTGLMRSPSYSASGLNASRTGGFSTVTGLVAGHGFQVGDRISTSGFVDATYNVARAYVTAVTNTTLIFAQPGVADDADAGGSGVVTKSSPYNVEARVIGDQPLVQARVWPDFGGNFNGANAGPGLIGPPPWESQWAMTWDFSTIGVTVPTEGVVTVGAGHHSSNSPIRYDNIEAAPVYGYNF